MQCRKNSGTCGIPDSGIISYQLPCMIWALFGREFRESPDFRNEQEFSYFSSAKPSGTKNGNNILESRILQISLPTCTVPLQQVHCLSMQLSPRRMSNRFASQRWRRNIADQLAHFAMYIHRHKLVRRRDSED